MKYLVTSLILLVSSSFVEISYAQTPPTNCANKPASLTVIRDSAFSSIPSDGWNYVYFDSANINGIISDSSAPKSPPFVSRQLFPAGLHGGDGGGYGPLTTHISPQSEVTYYCFWMKTDPAFEQHPVLTKLAWFHTPANNFLIVMAGDPFRIDIGWQWADNLVNNLHLGFVGSGFVFGSQTFGRNQWIQVEVLYKPSTTETSKDGVYCSWINNLSNACTFQINTPIINNLRLQTYDTTNISVWGGVGSDKTRNSFIYYDHWIIATGTSLSGLPSPPTPPGPPSGPVDNPVGAPNSPIGLNVSKNYYQEYNEFQQLALIKG